MDFKKWMVERVGYSGVSSDGGDIWKTASPVLNKLDDLCGQIVPLQYFGCFFNRKCERIAVTFAASFGIERIKSGLCGRG